jgi:predicted site-specific integrase-resolvase
MEPRALLRSKQAAERLGLSRSTLAKVRLAGDGPVFLKLGKAVRYHPEDLESCLAGRRRSSTSLAERIG